MEEREHTAISKETCTWDYVPCCLGLYRMNILTNNIKERREEKEEKEERGKEEKRKRGTHRNLNERQRERNYELRKCESIQTPVVHQSLFLPSIRYPLPMIHPSNASDNKPVLNQTPKPQSQANSSTCHAVPYAPVLPPAALPKTPPTRQFGREERTVHPKE